MSQTSPVTERLRQFAAYGDTAEGRILAQLALTEIERLRGFAQRPATFPYQQTFDAIAAAVSLYPDKHDPFGISISVRKFEEAFNSHRDTLADTSTTRNSK